MNESAARGRVAFEAWRNYFAPEKVFDGIVALGATSLRHGGPAEAVFRLRQRRMIARIKMRRRLRGAARTSVLKTLKMLGIKRPYQLNQPK